jgi:hypothetical protein
MRTIMKTRVTIPQSPLAQKLTRARIIQRDMVRLLVELEAQATGQAPVQPGSWRHHPAEWLAEHPVSSNDQP